jgi:hypothetical protein
MALAHFFTIVVLFAIWATTHLLLCVQLAKKDLRKGAAGFFAFPMAPYFGQSLRIKGLPTVWVVSALLYLLTLLVGAI